jgi:hypothetical protein
MSSYAECPCCNSKRRQAIKKQQVFVCSKCDAVYGDCYLDESYGLVKPFMSAIEVPQERVRYFDFTTLGSSSIRRRHGWFDRDTGHIVQVG